MQVVRTQTVRPELEAAAQHPVARAVAAMVAAGGLTSACPQLATRIARGAEPECCGLHALLAQHSAPKLRHSISPITGRRLALPPAGEAEAPAADQWPAVVEHNEELLAAAPEDEVLAEMLALQVRHSGGLL